MSRSVVVLEDSDEDFDTLLRAVRRVGVPYRILRAAKGDECLTLLRGTHGEPVDPTLVVLDLNTPGMDGREALRAIRADARWRTLPVVVVTTSTSPKDVITCYECGANAYHAKPVSYTEHLRTLEGVFAYWLEQAITPGRLRADEG